MRKWIPIEHLQKLLLLVGYFIVEFYRDTRAANAMVHLHEQKISSVEKLEDEMREVRIDLGTVKNLAKDIKEIGEEIKNNRCGHPPVARK